MVSPSIEAKFNKAVSLHQAGQLSEAEKLYRSILRTHSDQAKTLSMLGMLLTNTGRAEEAVKFIRRSISQNPGLAEPHVHYGQALRQLGRTEEAIESLRRALALAPSLFSAHYNLGNLLYDLGRPDEAIEHYRATLAIEPNLAEGYMALGNALRLTADYDRAVAALRQALKIRPDYAEAFDALGSIACDLGELQEAVSLHCKAIALAPAGAGFHSRLGVALYNSGRIDAAEGAFRTAISSRENDVEANFNLAAILLRTGRLTEGWRKYEWRRLLKGFPLVTTSKPEWEGQPLNGNTLVLYAEQGLGDTLQFARYATLAAALGARPVLMVQPPLVNLLRRVPGVADVVAMGEAVPFDYHLPLLSAPRLFGTTLETIPADIPYISVEPDRLQRWAAHMAGIKGLKVGLVWAGAPRSEDRAANIVDRRRSLRLDQFAPLADIPGVTLVSLQKGPPAEQLKAPLHGLNIVDLMDEVEDFTDTAAIIANLDLVISVDTSVAHLVGAMGKPLWLLSRFDGCWRWLLDREDTPWYPGARLFRQETPGDWSPVIDRIVQQLRALMSVASTTHGPAEPENSKLTVDQAVELLKAGKREQAETAFGELLHREPANYVVLVNYGILHHQNGNIEQAKRLLSQACSVNPAGHEALTNLGMVMKSGGDLTGALLCYQKALRLNPTGISILLNTGNLLVEMGSYSDAEAFFKLALGNAPDYPPALQGLGTIANDLGQFHEAVSLHRKAITLAPTGTGLHASLGVALYNSRQFEAAEEAFRTAVQMREDDSSAHYGLAATLLCTGRLREGWAEYEWRRNLKGFPEVAAGRPEWQGEPLNGKTLLLYSEQGLGDTLQFARYACLAAARGARPMLMVQPPLVNLLRRVPGVADVVATGEAVAVDYHLPLMSAPRLFGTTLETIPSNTPYISVDPGLIERWAGRMSGLDGLRIGLVWAGAPRPEDRTANIVDRRRSLGLDQFAPLAGIPGITLVSLQKGPPAEQLKAPSQGLDIINLMDEVEDFTDTAAIIANLDLVISVDTSVAHLVGAMGKPLWLLSRFDGCWRWLLDREDTPWYPGARLFRQETPGDWSQVIGRIIQELRNLTSMSRT